MGDVVAMLMEELARELAARGVTGLDAERYGLFGDLAHDLPFHLAREAMVAWIDAEPAFGFKNERRYIALHRREDGIRFFAAPVAGPGFADPEGWDVGVVTSIGDAATLVTEWLEGRPRSKSSVARHPPTWTSRRERE